MRCVNEGERAIWQFVIVKKTSISHFLMRLSYSWQWISPQHCQKSLRIHSTIASCIHSYFNNDVMTKFMINNGQMKNWRQFVEWKIAYLFVNTTRVLRRGPHSPHPVFVKIPWDIFPIPGCEVRVLYKIGYENDDLLSEPHNCIIFCLLNATHYCTTDFVSGTVEKEANGNDTFCFLNFEFI